VGEDFSAEWLGQYILIRTLIPSLLDPVLHFLPVLRSLPSSPFLMPIIMLIVVSSGSLSASLQWVAQNSLMMPLIILPLPSCFQSLSYLCSTESLRYEFCALCEQSKYSLLGVGGSAALQDFRQDQECLLDGVLPGRAVSYYSGGFPVTVIPRPLLYTYPLSGHLRPRPGFTIYACCLG